MTFRTSSSYFGKDEKIYVFKCKKWHKLDPIHSFVLGEQLGFLKLIKTKSTHKIDCPYCGSTALPIENLK